MSTKSFSRIHRGATQALSASLAPVPGSVPAYGLALFFALALSVCLTSPAAAVDIRYMAFGDSITAAWGFDETCNCFDEACRQACGYPRRLKNRLVAAGIDAGVLNEGLGGERTPEGLTRLDEILFPGVDVLLLMEGTNDISKNISPETTIFNLSEMARKADSLSVETIHATLIPRFPQAEQDAENVLNADLASRIRDLAFSTDRRLIDPYEVFSTTPNLFEERYATVETDPVGHPNSAGFNLLTQIFFDALMGGDEVPPVVGSVSPVLGAEGIAPLASVQVRLYDFGVGLDASFSTLLINDQPVLTQSSSGSNWQDLVYRPESSLPPEVAVRVQSRDLNLNSMDREVTRFTIDDSAPSPCQADSTTLCIDSTVGDSRFQLTLHWQTALNGGQEGDAETVPLDSIGLRRGGLFSFFDRDNPEVLVKVLDGCRINNHYWIFVAPTTTLGYELTVTDTVAALQGAARSEYEYMATNTDGEEAPPISNTFAFATCEFLSP